MRGIMQGMKTWLIVVGILIIAALGYFAFVQPAAAPTTESPTDTSSQAKLDINAVCEGALAYMTFENGAAAEVFVQACKEGKHPEVIEQWKVQMGITSEVAI